MALRVWQRNFRGRPFKNSSPLPISLKPSEFSKWQHIQNRRKDYVSKVEYSFKVTENSRAVRLGLDSGPAQIARLGGVRI